MIPIAEPYLNNEELENVIEAVKSGWISSKGKFIKEFENSFAKYCGRKYGVSTSNGTVALHLALVSLGVKEGDEVIVPDLTFISPANAVKYCNAKPVLVDVNKDYLGINPKKIEEKITPKTKAIILVHLYGYPCDIDAIKKVAEKHNLKIIEDAAEAHGAMYKNQKVGSFGDISCFSFYGNKIITTGEGGICLTDNKELADKIKILRDHGKEPGNKYYHSLVGFNYRMTNLQAAIGCAQLKKIDKILDKRKKIGRSYNNSLKELESKGKITLPKEISWSNNVYWMYSILIENNAKHSRDEIISRLKQKGIETRPFFIPLHLMPPHKIEGSFPISEELSKKGLNLPSSANLKKEEINRVCKEIKEIV